MKKNIVSMTAAVAVLVWFGSVIPAAAQATEIGFVNGTGAEVTGLILSPAKEQYPKNKNAYSPQSLQVNDGADFGITLPEHWNGIESFDIGVVSGNKMLITHRSIKLDMGSGKTPVLVLKDNGKISWAKFVGFFTGVITTATAQATQTVGNPLIRIVMRLPRPFNHIAWTLLPVAGGIIGYLAGEKVEQKLIPGGLDVQVHYN